MTLRQTPFLNSLSFVFFRTSISLNIWYSFRAFMISGWSLKVSFIKSSLSFGASGIFLIFLFFFAFSRMASKA